MKHLKQANSKLQESLKNKSKSEKKVHTVMKEFKKGILHSGKSGDLVKDRKQAIAIALSEAGLSKRK